MYSISAYVEHEILRPYSNAEAAEGMVQASCISRMSRYLYRGCELADAHVQYCASPHSLDPINLTVPLLLTGSASF